MSKNFQSIHYASKTMTEAQIHYTTTEKEMLAVVYAFEKFRPYLVLSKSIVYTDHYALKYLYEQTRRPIEVAPVGDRPEASTYELNELRDQAYENSLIYKERTKKLHDLKIKNRIFNVGDRVLLFNSRLKIFSGKLKTRWSGPFTITKVFPYGTIELSQPDGPNFKVNGHRVKHYFGGDLPPKLEIFVILSPRLDYAFDFLNSSMGLAFDKFRKEQSNDRVKYEWDAKQGLVGNLKSSCTDIAKITRKQSKLDKHGHENGKSVQEPEVF
ncbi:reverse transcriptase domain-containing protein [Tanacetum coccineum]|uniref:Reverse transcriptase domain-containing protein n=1 Tax=Tanacetum coccineum TaxID=301880 RepID=A0ABQ5F7L5_9ASTR